MSQIIWSIILNFFKNHIFMRLTKFIHCTISFKSAIFGFNHFLFFINTILFHRREKMPAVPLFISQPNV